MTAKRTGLSGVGVDVSVNSGTGVKVAVSDGVGVKLRSGEAVAVVVSVGGAVNDAVGVTVAGVGVGVQEANKTSRMLQYRR